MKLFYQKDGYSDVTVNIKLWFYCKPSVYQSPFLSIRWLCFEMIHNSIPIGMVMPSSEDY